MDVKPSNPERLDGSHHKCFIYLLLAKFLSLSLSLLFTLLFLKTLYLFVTTLHPSTSLHLIPFYSILSIAHLYIQFIFSFSLFSIFCLFIFTRVFLFSSYFLLSVLLLLSLCTGSLWTLNQIPCMCIHTWQ